MAHSYNPYYNEYHKNLEIQQNMKYKKKYRKLKRIVKDTVFENAALCDQVAQMQENLLIVKEERHFLLRKLYQQQGDVEPTTTTPTTITTTATSTIPKSLLNNSGSPCANHEGITPKKNVKKRNSTDVLETKSKPKRYCKAIRRVVQLIPLDVHGRPVFPIALGDLTVYSLGEVVSDRIAYHTEDLIYPVGYCSTRMYASLRDAHTKSLYTCKILDGGLNPRFEIVSDSDPDQPLVGLTPDECHSRLLSAISPTLRSIPLRGADFFGISHPTIQNLIQSSPGTRKLANYKSLRFEVCKNQNAADPPSSPGIEEEADPGLGFSALHRTFAIPSGYRIKEEPPDHDLLTFQDFLM